MDIDTHGICEGSLRYSVQLLKEQTMRCRIAIALGAAVILSVVPQATLLAQSAPPTYQGDPSVYKIIFENDSFRVIAATWKAGQTDQPHSHPIASVV